MPMTAAGLKAKLIEEFGPATSSDIQGDALEKLATAIVEYIQQNAQVNVTGVQAGGGTATGSIT